jgi:hypothetical protein
MKYGVVGLKNARASAEFITGSSESPKNAKASHKTVLLP